MEGPKFDICIPAPLYIKHPHHTYNYTYDIITSSKKTVHILDINSDSW